MLEKNQERAMDFMSDALANCWRIRTLNIIDYYNRKCQGIKISLNFSSQVLINELEKLIEKYGKPKGVRTDNGHEFSSKRFQIWMFKNNIEHIGIQKGKSF